MRPLTEIKLASKCLSVYFIVTKGVSAKLEPLQLFSFHEFTWYEIIFSIFNWSSFYKRFIKDLQTGFVLRTLRRCVNHRKTNLSLCEDRKANKHTTCKIRSKQMQLYPFLDKLKWFVSAVKLAVRICIYSQHTFLAP